VRWTRWLAKLVPTFAQRIPTAVNLGFLDWSRYFFIQIAPHLSSRGWVDPFRDSILLRKSDRADNQTQDLWISSQKLWPLDHRGNNAVNMSLRGYWFPLTIIYLFIYCKLITWI
jgi:hypothetical protein